MSYDQQQQRALALHEAHAHARRRVVQAASCASLFVLSILPLNTTAQEAPLPERAERAIWEGRATRRPEGPSMDRGGALSLLPPPDSASAHSDKVADLAWRGNALARKNQWAEAEPLFREAWGLKHSYDIGGNLGISEANLKKWKEAAEHLHFAIRSFPVNGKPEHRRLLEHTFAKVRAEVGALQIQVNTPGAEVTVDGESVGRAPREEEVFVLPGSHAVEATLSGYTSARQQVLVEKGGAQSVALALAAVQSAPVSKVPAGPAAGHGEEQRPGVSKGVLIAGGVLAVAGLGAGIGLTVAANAKSSDADARRASILSADGQCVKPPGAFVQPCKDLKDTLRGQDAFANGARVAFVGASVVALGVAVYALLPRRRPITQGRVSAVPIVASDGGGMAVMGAW